MQHARRVTNATAIHGHIDDLSLHFRRLPRVGIPQEKRATRAQDLATSIPLLALTGCTMSHDIRTLTVGTVQRVANHATTVSRWGFYFSHAYKE